MPRLHSLAHHLLMASSADLSPQLQNIFQKSVTERAETVAQILHFAFTCTPS
jgi:hypothetical protein